MDNLERHFSKVVVRSSGQDPLNNIPCWEELVQGRPMMAIYCHELDRLIYFGDQDPVAYWDYLVYTLNELGIPCYWENFVCYVDNIYNQEEVLNNIRKGEYYETETWAESVN